LHLYLGLDEKKYPVTSRVYKSAVSLPIYPDLKESQLNLIIKGIKRLYSS